MAWVAPHLQNGKMHHELRKYRILCSLSPETVREGWHAGRMLGIFSGLCGAITSVIEDFPALGTPIRQLLWNHMGPPQFDNPDAARFALSVLPVLGTLVQQGLWSQFDAYIWRGIANEFCQ